ncbi:hypothetical protein IPM19_01375 [bacterium]|nr:MAG: hypothetical protein IPM19_01375 [bacterium]
MEDKNKKLSYAIIALAVVALVVITVWQPGEWSFRDRTNYDAATKAAQEELEQYKAFLAELDPNYEASQQLLEKIATEDVVREQVETVLNTKQRIVVPQLANSEIKISSRKDAGFVVNYLTDINSMVTNYRNAINTSVNNLYSANASLADLQKGKSETAKLVASLKSAEVPSSLVEMHKANIVSFQKYGEIFDSATGYSEGRVAEPWADFYQDYAVIDNRLAVVNSELEKTAQQYAMAGELEQNLNVFGIKTAQAQIPSVVTVSTDLKRDILEGVKMGLAKAFANFSIKMLDKLVAHIEKSFAIASQLYYSNELGRFYSVEYMKKFVSDPLDQDIIQKFLPEYFCINPSKKDLNQIFVAKARENIGNDLTINPGDPDFVQKLARLGSDEKNYPQWWEGYYETLAARTKAEAEAAATKEVLSPGIKTGRDLVSSQVNKTVSAIFNVQEAAISGAIELGTNNTENPVSQLVAGVVENLVNKFVFTPISGGSSSSGGIGVIQERNVCLDTASIKPLIPLASSGYENSEGSGSSTAPVSTPPFSPRE